MSCGLLGGQPSGETLTHEFWKRHQFVIGPDREANERHNIRELTARNVRFISAREHIDPSTPEGKFNATILTGSNQLQREQTARRTKDSLAQKVERGEPVSRLLPGYKRVKSVLPSGAVKTTIELEPISCA